MIKKVNKFSPFDYQYLSSSLDTKKQFKSNYQNSDVVNKIFNLIDFKDYNFANTILVYGQIQSGKTKFMIELINKVLKHDSKVLFLLLSNCNINVANQNAQRIKDELNRNKIEVNIHKFNDFENINDDTFNIVSLIKNVKHLDNFLYFYNENCKRFNKLIILDDECDIESTNKKESNEIYKKLIAILKLAKNSSGFLNLQITATPHNFFLKNYKCNDFLKIKDMYILEPGEKYFGLEKFSKFIFTNSSNIRTFNLYKEEYMDSLLDPLFEYFLQCYKYASEFYPRMLINVSESLDEQEKIVKFLKVIFQRIYSGEYHLQDIKRFDKFFKDFNLEQHKDNFYIWLKINIKKFEAFSYNGNNTQYINEKLINLDYDSTTRFQIIVGCKKVNRGLTIKNLTTSVLWSSNCKNKNISTLLQESRWFGYRDKYLNDIRIYVSDTYKVLFLQLNNLWNIHRYVYKNFELNKVEKIMSLTEKNNVFFTEQKDKSKDYRMLLKKLSSYVMNHSSLIFKSLNDIFLNFKENEQEFCMDEKIDSSKFNHLIINKEINDDVEWCIDKRDSSWTILYLNNQDYYKYELKGYISFILNNDWILKDNIKPNMHYFLISNIQNNNFVYKLKL